MQTGRRLDTIDDHAQIAERVRKLEIMPNPGAEAGRWTPSKADLHAIAGHVYMLGCYTTPTEGPDGTGGGAHPGQAAQMLWALLDQRGFTSTAEGQDWTDFLTRLGGLPHWGSYTGGAITMTAGTLYTGYTPDVTAGQIHYQNRALYWAGLPPLGTWDFTAAGQDIGGAFDTVIVPDGGGTVKLWDADPADTSFNAGMFWNTASDPVISPATTYVAGEEILWCGDVGPHYNSATDPGIPFPYSSGNTPCPNSPGSFPIGGQVTRVRLLLPIDLYLSHPPRLMDPTLWADDFSHPVFGDAAVFSGGGPGWDWLETGIATILAEHPHVAAFYAEHLPIAYARKNQTGHRRHRQLELYLGWKGGVDAHLERDRVILKGRVDWWGNLAPQTPILIWPDDWPLPPYPYAFHVAHDDNGNPVPLMYQFAGGIGAGTLSVYENWTIAETVTGPLTVVLDGLTIPIPAITGTMPDG